MRAAAVWWKKSQRLSRPANQSNDTQHKHAVDEGSQHGIEDGIENQLKARREIAAELKRQIDWYEKNENGGEQRDLAAGDAPQPGDIIRCAVGGGVCGCPAQHPVADGGIAVPKARTNTEIGGSQ